MHLTTPNNFADFEITKTLGLAFGNTVRTRHVGSHLFAHLRGLFGGEMTSYSDLLTHSRQDALNRLITAAKEMGADGIVAIRFSTSSITDGATELLATGTAVKLKARI